MDETPLCSIILSSQISAEDRESLENALQLARISLQKPSYRVIGVDDIVFVATVLGGLAATANLIEYGIKLAKAINRWRQELRAKGMEPQGKLEHPKRLSLDLSQATDEEIIEWLSQQK